MRLSSFISSTRAIGSVAATAATVGLLTVAVPAQTQPAQTTQDACQALRVIGGSGATLVRKVIQPGGLGPGNLNTDFEVPGGQRFSHYVLELMPENNEHYHGSVSMKYADGNTTTVYNNGANLQRGRTYYLPFQPPNLQQPFQINLFVGSSRNNAYQARIWACQRN